MYDSACDLSFPSFCIFLYKSQKWGFLGQGYEHYFTLPNCLQKGCVNLRLPFSSTGLPLVSPQPCQQRLSPVLLLTESDWFWLFHFACLWSPERSNIFLHTSFPNSFFFFSLSPLSFHTLCPFILFIGRRRFQCFTNWYDKEEGSLG